MTKTLADMTPQERAQCRGMWCETALSKALVIYVAGDQDNEEKAVVVNPKSQFRTVTPLRALTPRPDLPRAWQADGQPPAGEYQYAVQYKTPNGWEYTYESWDCRWQESEAVQEVRAYRDHPDEETRLVRRLVSQPEEVQP